ncbi:Leu/Val/Ile amino-acid permease [Wickerhamomyces ciferrii]|uniref:Leu/Val/Ile amino-acid permease n=1 Tax=Wickerhamomyces ciferrii (strain ATCC 14091 / BCRC 22168 / CBS 111 / JCM 3599 / NBRC 0793 / NRRL Y-1031 F-60-10) TaxID=1206466 RepID=K0KIP5_WICCF|nr:Leu/Val/Ile amino-acid permease [Wickerhamomyces ciferrii]CCH41254.1 Leu/Val/Ile amino-acid permease [Wickerhamomyces ciferrii]
MSTDNIKKQPFEITPEISDKADSSSYQEAHFTENLPNDDSSKFQRFKNSFKRMNDDIDPNLSDAEKAEIIQYRNQGEKLNKSLKQRHMLLIAIATGIGTGLLVGAGSSLAKGGPAGLIIGTIIIGSMLVNVMEAAGELALTYGDLTGGFNAYTSFLVDDSFCFAVSWNYCIQWLCVMPLELVTASMTIKYWTTSVNPDVFVAIFYVLIVVINLIGSSGYGEAEFLFNCAKVLMLIGFTILSIIISVGGAGDKGYIGAHYWHNPGAFANSFKGVCAVFINMAFAFGCTEANAFMSSEAKNPRRAIPSASKQVVYKVVFMFIIPIFLIGLLVPYNSDELLGSSGSKTHSSPFVIAVSSVPVVPHFVNAVILIAVLSVGNSAFFIASRTLQSLAEQGFAPKYFNYIDRSGRPLRALVFTAIIGLFSFIAAYDKQETVFTWLLSLSGLSQIFTWSGICLSHIRLRKAFQVQGYSTNELGYKSKTGVLGSWYGLIINVLVLIAQFWIALWPIGGDGKADANAFFQNYLGAVVCLVMYVGHKLYSRNWRFWIPADQIDLRKGRKIFDADVLAQEDAEEAEQIRNSPFYVRIFPDDGISEISELFNEFSGTLKGFKDHYPSSLLHSNIDTLRSGKLCKVLSNYPANSRHNRRSTIARRIVGKAVEGFSISSSIDKVVFKFTGLFDLMPYEKYSAWFFFKRSEVLISQMLARIRIQIRHINWKTRIHVMYPLRYSTNLVYETIIKKLSPRFNNLIMCFKSFVPSKSKYRLYSLGDKSSLLGPFPMEIWIMILEQAEIDQDRGSKMIYNSLWIDLIAPYVYTNIHCFLSIRNISELKIDDYDFVYNGPNLFDYGYSDFNKFSRLKNSNDYEYEILDLYPSSKKRLDALKNTKSLVDQSSISVVTTHKSLLKLVRTLKNKNSIMRKYIKNISLDVFASNDWLSRNDASQIKENFCRTMKDRIEDQVNISQHELDGPKIPLIHMNEFDHLVSRKYCYDSSCKNMGELQHLFNDSMNEETLANLRMLGVVPLRLFEKSHYTTQLCFMNKIIDCFISGERQKMRKVEEVNANEVNLFFNKRTTLSPGIPLHKDPNHELDLSLAASSYIQSKCELARFVDDVVYSFLSCEGVNASVNILGASLESPIYCNRRLWSVYPNIQLITLNKNLGY